MATRQDVFPSKYLKSADLGGVDLPVTVKIASLENITAPGEAPTQKVVLYFKGGIKPLILNATNFRMMEDITGQADSDRWNDAQIKLVSERVSFAGKMYDSVRVKPIQQLNAEVSPF